MKTDVSIAEASWFHAETTRRVMAALEAAKPGGSRFVGGCIRNTLMGRAASDIDIATQLLPDDTMKALKAAGIRAIPTGIEHGTITAICNHEPYEITTLRRDVETDGRRAVVAFTEDWAEDAQRRDFRLNALYADGEGRVYDPTGGLPDIAAHRVIFIGDAEQRLREDHLRNLRFFRFTAWYAREIDTVGLAACAEFREGLKQIAAERIWKEFLRFLEAPQPYAALSAMMREAVLDVILPEADERGRLARVRGIESAEGLVFDPIQRLMSLLPRRLDVAQSVSARLKTSRAERDRLVRWAKASPPPMVADALKPWLYRLDPQAGLDVMLWEWASDGQPGRPWRAMADLAKDWERPEFPVRGADLVASGVPAGPKLGESLRELEARWIANGFSMDGISIRSDHSEK